MLSDLDHDPGSGVQAVGAPRDSLDSHQNRFHIPSERFRPCNASRASRISAAASYTVMQRKASSQCRPCPPHCGRRGRRCLSQRAQALCAHTCHHVRARLPFHGGKDQDLVATFRVARLTLQTRKLWCRNGPSRALPLTCPNVKKTFCFFFFFKKKRKQKNKKK